MTSDPPVLVELNEAVVEDCDLPLEALIVTGEDGRVEEKEENPKSKI